MDRRHAVHKFGVFLRSELTGKTRFAWFEAETRHLAAAAAEARHPGYRAVAVTVRHEVVGRCIACEAILFPDERPQPSARGGFRCFEC